MAIVGIPLQTVPSQTVTIVLGAQPCTITLRQLADGRQYFSLSWNGTVLCSSVLIQNRTALVRSASSGFVGDIASIDTQGDEPPDYTQWGSRWLLLYNPDSSS